MTLRDALLASKENGKTYMRLGSGYGGWIQWDPKWIYRDLSAEDLVADDWVTSSEGIPATTGGRWKLADDEDDDEDA